jgi:hypothetical protein
MLLVKTSRRENLICPVSGIKEVHYAQGSDATQNVRVLEGGNGSNRLAFGKVQSSVGDDLTGFCVMMPTKEAEPK